jgi:hypothetical protein
MDIIDIGLRFTYVILIIGALAAIVMPLIQALTNDPKSLLKSAAGLGAIVLIYLIGYALASDEVTAKYVEFEVDSGISKMVGGVLITMYIMMIVALGGALFGEVKKIIE